MQAKATKEPTVPADIKEKKSGWSESINQDGIKAGASGRDLNKFMALHTQISAREDVEYKMKMRLRNATLRKKKYNENAQESQSSGSEDSKEKKKKKEKKLANSIEVVDSDDLGASDSDA